MLYICIFSNKFDINQAISVSHTGALQIVWNPAPYAMYSTHITIIKFNNQWRIISSEIQNPRYLPYLKQRGTSEVSQTETSTKTMNRSMNWQFCYFCKRYNHRQEECCTQILENQPRTGQNDTPQKRKHNREKFSKFRHSQDLWHLWSGAQWSFQSYFWLLLLHGLTGHLQQTIWDLCTGRQS